MSADHDSLKRLAAPLDPAQNVLDVPCVNCGAPKSAVVVSTTPPLGRCTACIDRRLQEMIDKFRRFRHPRGGSDAPSR